MDSRRLPPVPVDTDKGFASSARVDFRVADPHVKKTGKALVSGGAPGGMSSMIQAGDIW